MRYWELHEEQDKRLGVVFTFGRFNPPTIGHKENFEFVKKLADKQSYAHIIYVSPKQDFSPDENNIPKGPLTLDRKSTRLNASH